MKKFFTSIAIAALAALGFGSLATAQTTPVVASGLDYVEQYQQESNDGNETNLMDRVKVIINVVIGVIGLICVVMIIVGGIMYTTSQGNPDKVKQAKDIILYSIVGLVVALLAFAVVNFVLVNVFNQ